MKRNTFKDTILPLLVVIPMIALAIWINLPEVEEKIELINRETLSKKLRILIWQEYIPEDGAERAGVTYHLYNQFAREHGIDVQVDYFDTNEELHDRLKAEKGNIPYDIIMPSNHLLPTLVEGEFIQEINHDNIPHFEEIDSSILDDYEMQEIIRYSVPYIFGVTGLAYDSWKSPEIPLHWGFLLEPGKEADAVTQRNIYFTLERKISLIDDMRTAMGTALIYLNYKPDTRDEKQVREATELLINAIRNLKIRFESTYVANNLVDGDSYMAMAWSGDAMKAMEASLQQRRAVEREKLAKLKKGKTEQEASERDEIPKIRFTSPHPQALAFIDCFAIVKDTPNLENAETFLDFLLDPVIAAKVTNYSYYGNTVEASREFVNRDILNGPPYFLPGDNSVSFITVLDEDTHAMYEEYWAEVKRVYDEVHSVKTVSK